MLYPITKFVMKKLNYLSNWICPSLPPSSEKSQKGDKHASLLLGFLSRLNASSVQIEDLNQFCIYFSRKFNLDLLVRQMMV